jgi:hypothetical protein
MITWAHKGHKGFFSIKDTKVERVDNLKSNSSKGIFMIFQQLLFSSTIYCIFFCLQYIFYTALLIEYKMIEINMHMLLGKPFSSQSESDIILHCQDSRKKTQFSQTKIGCQIAILTYKINSVHSWKNTKVESTKILPVRQWPLLENSPQKENQESNVFKSTTINYRLWQGGFTKVTKCLLYPGEASNFI